MSEPEPVDLADLFPEMKPIKRPPSLFTINGIGTVVYGKRDEHEESGTHVKTLWLCFLFIPVWPITAYRVAPAGGRSWYFLGKEPLSGLARAWRTLLIAGVLASICTALWEHYTSSPEYRAREQLAAADNALEEGRIQDAVSGYIDVYPWHPESRPRIGESLGSALSTSVPQAPPDEQAQIYREFAQFCRAGGRAFQPDVLQAVLAWCAARDAAGDPVAALDLLGETRNVFDADRYAQARRPLLEHAAREVPPHPASVEELALLLEAEGAPPADLKALLDPLPQELGSSECARILGQLYAAEGDQERAYALLRPYVKDRLTALEAGEKAHDRAIETAWDQAIARLQHGASGFNYAAYEAASEERQQELVTEFAQKAVLADLNVKQRRQQLGELTAVVPVALDLGVAMLARARTLTDPAEKQAELEAAEDTFLAIGGFAGESAEYKLFLGQVKYWLGKHDEGRELLEGILSQEDASAGTRLAVSHTLREVGEYERAREVAEHAYEQATSDDERYGAARMRALLFEDLDDNIEWLEKCDPIAPDVKANLEGCKGDRALRAANMEEAASHYRRAIRGHEQLPETSSSLNNTALVYLDLFRAEGRPADHARGIELMRQSVALDPSGSIGLLNLSNSLPAAAALELTAEQIDYSLLNSVPDTDVFRYLATSAAELEEWRQRFRDHPATSECLEIADRLMLLAPRGAQSYLTPLEVIGFLRDQVGLETLAARIAAGRVDTDPIVVRALERFSGAHDPEDMERSVQQRERMRSALQVADEGGDRLLGAMLGIQLVLSELNWSTYGGDMDGAALLADSLAAVDEHPSLEAHRTLVSVHLRLAVDALASASAPLRAIRERTRFAIGPAYLLALALEHDEELRPLVLADEHFQQGVAALRQQHERFPGECGAWAWALTRRADPELGAAIAKRIEADTLHIAYWRASLALNPLDPHAAYELLWRGEIMGEDTGASAILEGLGERGVPLPYSN